MITRLPSIRVLLHLLIASERLEAPSAPVPAPNNSVRCPIMSQCNHTELTRFVIDCSPIATATQPKAP